MSDRTQFIAAGMLLAMTSVLPIASFGQAPAVVQSAPLAAESAPKVVHTPKGVKIEAENQEDAPTVTVTKFDTVSLNVQNADLGSVLQLLSIQSNRNIVPSPKVTGVVTANLYDVTFEEALDAILQQNGAGYIQKGNFIYVYTVDELKKIKEEQRKVETRIFKLNYMTARDATAFLTSLSSTGVGSIASITPVKEGFQPSLSDGGANTHANGEVLMVRDYAETLDEMAQILTALDTPPAQVLVEATIVKAELNEDLAFGVDISILANIGPEAIVGSPLSTVGGMINGTIQERPTSTINSTVGNVASGDGGIKIGVLTNNVAAFIRALDKVTDTTVLSNPKIMTLNRQKAEVLVGQKVAYLSTTATATATTQTVEFLDTGTKLTLRPFVSSDGMIRLELKPSISSADLRLAGAGTGSVTLPDETTQEITTNVMVRDGQTVVLGGLFQEQTTITRNQIPGLGDIPFVGNAFKGTDNNSTRSEVIFLITPHIVKDAMLTAAGNSTADAVDKLRLGMRQGLLPWSRTKMTAGHVREALKYLETGDTDKALWEVDMALSMDPAMPEARRIKERLTGQRTYLPSGSLLDDAVDMMVDDQAGGRVRTRPTVIVPSPEPSLPQRPEGYDPAAEKYQPRPAETIIITPPTKPEDVDLQGLDETPVPSAK